MAANTAVGAEKKDIRTITFKNKEHRDFYKVNLQKCRYQDYTIRHWCIALELTGIQG